MLSKVLQISLTIIAIYYAARIPQTGQNKILIILSVALSSLAFYSWFNYEVPNENDLIPLQGKVVESFRRNDSNDDIIFRLDTYPTYFTYVAWYPDYSEVEFQLQIDHIVSVWYDKNDDSKQPSIWRLDKNGKTVVSFFEITNARKHNVQIALYLGILFVACLVFGIIREYNHRRKVAA